MQCRAYEPRRGTADLDEMAEDPVELRETLFVRFLGLSSTLWKASDHTGTLPANLIAI